MISFFKILNLFYILIFIINNNSFSSEVLEVFTEMSPKFSENSENLVKEFVKFEDFLSKCGDQQERVLLCGAGRFHWNKETFYEYKERHPCPSNVYLLDTRDDDDIQTDLQMDVGIEKLPEKYQGKFDIVIFEGIHYENYHVERAFSNVNKLLKENGIFLVYCQEEDITELEGPLIANGFEELSFIDNINKVEDKIKKYMSHAALLDNESFLNCIKVNN